MTNKIHVYEAFQSGINTESGGEAARRVQFVMGQHYSRTWSLNNSMTNWGHSGLDIFPNTQTINTLRSRQNGRHFADGIFKCIFLNKNVWIPIKNSLKFVSKGPINNIPTLVQIMVWRRSGDKPLSESMLVSLLTHICVTRPQWVKKCIQGLREIIKSVISWWHFSITWICLAILLYITYVFPYQFARRFYDVLCLIVKTVNFCFVNLL